MQTQTAGQAELCLREEMAVEAERGSATDLQSCPRPQPCRPVALSNVTQHAWGRLTFQSPSGVRGVQVDNWPERLWQGLQGSSAGCRDWQKEERDKSFRNFMCNAGQTNPVWSNLPTNSPRPSGPSAP